MPFNGVFFRVFHLQKALNAFGNRFWFSSHIRSFDRFAITLFQFIYVLCSFSKSQLRIGSFVNSSENWLLHHIIISWEEFTALINVARWIWKLVSFRMCCREIGYSKYRQYAFEQISGKIKWHRNKVQLIYPLLITHTHTRKINTIVSMAQFGLIEMRQ